MTRSRRSRRRQGPLPALGWADVVDDHDGAMGVLGHLHRDRPHERASGCAHALGADNQGVRGFGRAHQCSRSPGVGLIPGDSQVGFRASGAQDGVRADFDGKVAQAFDRVPESDTRQRVVSRERVNDM